MSEWDELFGVETKDSKTTESTSPATPTSKTTTIRRKRSVSKPDPHKLNKVNMIRFVTAKGTMKKVEANWFFLPTPAREVSDLIDSLLREGVFKRIKHGWIVISEKLSL